MKSTIFGTKYLKTMTMKSSYWIWIWPVKWKNDYLRALCPKQLWQRRRRWEGQLLVGGWNNKQASDVSDKLVKNIYIFFNFLVYFRPVHQTLFAQKNYSIQCTIYFLCFAFNRWFWRDVSEGPSSCIDKGTLCCVRHTLREPHAQIRNMIYHGPILRLTVFGTVL